MYAEASQVDLVFQALGDPTRRALFETLCRRPASVSELAEPLAITLAAVTQHVQVLERSGLVVTEKVGRVRSCRIQPDGVLVLDQWLAARRSDWQQKSDRLGSRMSELDPAEPGTESRQ